MFLIVLIAPSAKGVRWLKRLFNPSYNTNEILVQAEFYFKAFAPTQQEKEKNVTSPFNADTLSTLGPFRRSWNRFT